MLPVWCLNPRKDFQTEVWLLSESCQILDLPIHQNNLSWPNASLLKSVWILGWNATKLLTGMEKTLLMWLSDWKTPYWQEFYPRFLSVSSVLWHKCQRVSHPAALHQFMQRVLGDLIVFGSYLILITMGRMYCLHRQSWNIRFTNQPTEELKIKKVCYKTN